MVGRRVKPMGRKGYAVSSLCRFAPTAHDSDRAKRVDAAVAKGSARAPTPPQRAPLSVDAAQLDGVSYPADGEHVSRDAVVDVLRIGEVHDVFKGLAQDELKLLVHGGFLPEISLAVLHPLKVRSGDAAGVGENVWNDKDFFVGQDFIGGGGGGTVGAFANDFGLDAGRVLAG